MIPRFHPLQPVILLIVSAAVFPATTSAAVYELRTYTTNEGKLDALNARFRDHTVGLFEKHGMQSIGYWVPVDEPESKNTLIYVLKHESRDAAKASWKAFLGDPAWKKVAKESQLDGRILKGFPKSVFMEAADYSPSFKSEGESGDAVFELRTYRTREDKLANLDSRFRDHTIDIFARHGMQSVAYWHPTKKPDFSDTLIYIIRHASRDAAKGNWSGFVKDEEWKKVFKASRVDGPLLREAPGSVYMQATDYSAIK